MRESGRIHKKGQDMKHYLIAVDMDGTLLTSQNTVTHHSIEVLQALSAMGHYVVPASGRAITLLPRELRRIQGLTYAITENGALIWDYHKNAIKQRRLMPVGSAAAILQDAAELPCCAEVFANGGAYVEAGSVPTAADTPEMELFVHYMRENHLSVRRLLGETALLEDAEKVNLYFEDPKAGKPLRAKWEKDPELSVTTSITGNVEFNAGGVHKGSALRFLSELLDVPKECILAFGDNENDLEMFAEAGTAVAMENAKQEIRDAADFVAGDHDADGVAVFLERFFGIGQ